MATFKFTHPFSGKEVEFSENRMKCFKSTYRNIEFDIKEDKPVEEKPKKSTTKSPKKNTKDE